MSVQTDVAQFPSASGRRLSFAALRPVDSPALQEVQQILLPGLTERETVQREVVLERECPRRVPTERKLSSWRSTLNVPG